MLLARVGLISAAATFPACSHLPAARFGTVDGLSVAETHHIPYAVGAHYGFRVDYHDSGRPITLREDFQLPGPAHWYSAQKFVASAGGRIMTCQVQLGSRTPAPPEIHSIYIEDLQIARGDPKRDYRIKLFLDDKAWKEFQFTIE
jgi:hypothetical protein